MSTPRPADRQARPPEPDNPARIEPFRHPHDTATVAAKLRENARHYACKGRKKRFGGMIAIMRVRRRELEAIFHARYGDTLPDSEIGRARMWLLAQTIAGCGGDAYAIMARARQWCPWMSHGDRAALAERVLAEPQHWTADQLGRALHLILCRARCVGHHYHRQLRRWQERATGAQAAARPRCQGGQAAGCWRLAPRQIYRPHQALA